MIYHIGHTQGKKRRNKKASCFNGKGKRKKRYESEAEARIAILLIKAKYKGSGWYTIYSCRYCSREVNNGYSI